MGEGQRLSAKHSEVTLSGVDRRTLLGAAALASLPSKAASQGRYPEPGLTFVFEAEVLLGPIQEMGVVDGMRRRIVPISGGSVAGPRLKATILPGGADWQGVRPGDGLTRVHARYWMKAEDGAVIGIDNSGIRRASAAVMRRLMMGQDVAPDDYYFRTVPFFEAGEGPHQWLNETMFVCVGARKPDRAIIRIYAVT